MVRLEQLEVLADAPPFSSGLLRSLQLRGAHFGCARLLKPGWLNTDAAPLRVGGAEAEPDRITRYEDDLYYLRHDATRPFPIETASFDWAYSEHFVEHVTPGDAVRWLAEVRRLVRPGGRIRLTTPDLRKYVEGYLNPGNGFYVEHSAQIAKFLDRVVAAGEDDPPRWHELKREYFAGETETPRRPAFMLNQIFFLWEHRWIYDLEELRHVAALAGFDPGAVAERAYGEGEVPEMAALDLPPRRDETVYVEIERT
jgi:SAM-dependent methyltransferase